MTKETVIGLVLSLIIVGALIAWAWKANSEWIKFSSDQQTAIENARYQH